MGINSGEVSSLPTKEAAVSQCWKSPAPTEDYAIFQSSSSPSPWHHQLGGQASACNALLNWREVNSQSQQASQLLTKSSCSEALLSAVPQMKACIVGGCRRSALPGGWFRCSATQTPTLGHCSEMLLSSSQGTVLLAVARIQQQGTEQLW